eukprot:361809-Chlamydomonas_euryale.AAC.2
MKNEERVASKAYRSQIRSNDEAKPHSKLQAGSQPDTPAAPKRTTEATKKWLRIDIRGGSAKGKADRVPKPRVVPTTKLASKAQCRMLRHHACWEESIWDSEQRLFRHLRRPPRTHNYTHTPRAGKGGFGEVDLCWYAPGPGQPRRKVAVKHFYLDKVPTLGSLRLIARELEALKQAQGIE